LSKSKRETFINEDSKLNFNFIQDTLLVNGGYGSFISGVTSILTRIHNNETGFLLQSELNRLRESLLKKLHKKSQFF
jgi:hypothetical protein